MSSSRPDRRRHQPLFLRDLSSPVASSSRRLPASSPRRETLAAATPPPPPPLRTLDELPGLSPSPQPLTPSPSPPPRSHHFASSPSPLRSGASAKGAPGTGLWWSPARGRGAGGEEKGREASPVEGVVQQQQQSPSSPPPPQQQALITLPPPREVARPEVPRDSLPAAGRIDEEEWVTVFGFLPGDTNLELREFEKCGIVLRHVLGPRDANWIHILYQSRHDAQRALAKHGQQLNSLLIIGVKPVDPWQRQYLNENTDENYQGDAAVPFPSLPVAPSSSATRSVLAPLSSILMPNGSSNEPGRNASGAIASPAKSVLSKVMDLMFGL